MAARLGRFALFVGQTNKNLLQRSSVCLLNGPSTSLSPTLCSSGMFGQSLTTRNATTTSLISPRSLQFESHHSGNNTRMEGNILGLAAGLSFFFAFAEEAEGEEKKYTKADSARVIKEADELYTAKRMKEYYLLLEAYNKCVNDDVETAWRHARAAYEYAQLEKDPLKKQLIYQSREIAQHSLTIDANHHQTQKWNGISTSAVTDYEGITKKIELSYTIREYFEKVIELKPSDPYGPYLLGKWQWTFSEMPWYTRKVAATFFATPPSSTYEEALQSFLKAEELKIGYLDCKLMIGKCYQKIGNKEEATKWLTTVVNSPPQYHNDHGVIKEAGDILKSL